MNRVLTAAGVVAATLLAVWFVPPPYFALPVLIAAFLATREFYDLAEAAGAQPYRRLGFVAVAALVMRMELPLQATFADPVLVGCVAAILLAILLRPERQAQGFADVGATLLGLVYPGLLLGLLCSLQRLGGPRWLTFLFVVVWVGDTGALYAGRLWGRHPMAPRVSPKKTWEGAVASVALAFVVAGVAGRYLQLGDTFVLLGALGVAVNVAAQCGDLVESGFKRAAQVKDSGSLLPGHGGMLDRMDAMLFAAPVLWYYLTFLHS